MATRATNIYTAERSELEQLCGELHLQYDSDTSDQELRWAIDSEQQLVRRRDAGDELRDERSDEDVYEGCE